MMQDILGLTGLSKGGSMIFGALIIDFLFIGLGALLRTTAIDPNPVFGYRTTRSMQSPEAWAYANRKSGSLMIVVGLVGLAATLIVIALDMALSLTSTDEGVFATMCFTMGLPLAGIGIAVACVERDLKKRFSGTVSDTEKPGSNAPIVQPSLSAAQKIVFGILCVLPLIVAICGFAALPDTISVHFDATGPDGWAPKTTLFLFAAIMAAGNGVLAFAYRVFLREQKRTDAASLRSALFVAFAACMFASSFAVLFILLYNLA